MAVCYGIAKKGSQFDCLIVTPDPVERRLEDQVTLTLG
jgi:hypothetical protein